MCVDMPIPPVITVLFDPDQIQPEVPAADVDMASGAETIPYMFDSFNPRRGVTRVWADMVDSDDEEETRTRRETVQERHLRLGAEQQLRMDAYVIETYEVQLLDSFDEALANKDLRDHPRPMMTLQPLSFRLSAWAWPCDP